MNNVCFAQLIDYYYREDETWQVWPPDLSLKTFRGLAPSIVDLIIGSSLCNPIREYIKQAKNEIMNDLQDFQTALQKLRDNILPYNTTINSNVPR
jgi:hypothetical protein